MARPPKSDAAEGARLRLGRIVRRLDADADTIRAVAATASAYEGQGTVLRLDSIARGLAEVAAAVDHERIVAMEHAVLAAYVGMSSVRFARLYCVACVEASVEADAGRLNVLRQDSREQYFRRLLGSYYPELARPITRPQVGLMLKDWTSPTHRFARIVDVQAIAWKGLIPRTAAVSLRADWFKYATVVRPWLRNYVPEDSDGEA